MEEYIMMESIRLIIRILLIIAILFTVLTSLRKSRNKYFEILDSMDYYMIRTRLRWLITYAKLTNRPMSEELQLQIHEYLGDDYDW